MKNTNTTEPTVIVGAISAVVAALMALLIAFGIDITPDQTVAVLGVVAAVGPFVAALFIRRKVTPNINVVEAVTREGEVVAGPANEIATGEVIRKI